MEHSRVCGDAKEVPLVVQADVDATVAADPRPGKSHAVSILRFTSELRIVEHHA